MGLIFVNTVDVTSAPVRAAEEFFNKVVMGDTTELASVAAKG